MIHPLLIFFCSVQHSRISFFFGIPIVLLHTMHASSRVDVNEAPSVSVTDLLYVTDWVYVADSLYVTELNDTHDSIKLLKSDDNDDLFDLYTKVSSDAVSEVDTSKTYSELCTQKSGDDGYQHNVLRLSATLGAHNAVDLMCFFFQSSFSGVCTWMTIFVILRCPPARCLGSSCQESLSVCEIDALGIRFGDAGLVCGGCRAHRRLRTDGLQQLRGIRHLLPCVLGSALQ